MHNLMFDIAEYLIEIRRKHLHSFQFQTNYKACFILDIAPLIPQLAPLKELSLRTLYDKLSAEPATKCSYFHSIDQICSEIKNISGKLGSRGSRKAKDYYSIICQNTSTAIKTRSQLKAKLKENGEESGTDLEIEIYAFIQIYQFDAEESYSNKMISQNNEFSLEEFDVLNDENPEVSPSIAIHIIKNNRNISQVREAGQVMMVKAENLVKGNLSHCEDRIAGTEEINGFCFLQVTSFNWAMIQQYLMINEIIVQRESRDLGEQAFQILLQELQNEDLRREANQLLKNRAEEESISHYLSKWKKSLMIRVLNKFILQNDLALMHFVQYPLLTFKKFFARERLTEGIKNISIACNDKAFQTFKTLKQNQHYFVTQFIMLSQAEKTQKKILIKFPQSIKDPNSRICIEDHGTLLILPFTSFVINKQSDNEIHLSFSNREQSPSCSKGHTLSQIEILQNTHQQKEAEFILKNILLDVSKIIHPNSNKFTFGYSGKVATKSDEGNQVQSFGQLSGDAKSIVLYCLQHLFGLTKNKRDTSEAKYYLQTFYRLLFSDINSERYFCSLLGVADIGDDKLMREKFLLQKINDYIEVENYVGALKNVKTIIKGLMADKKKNQMLMKMMYSRLSLQDLKDEPVFAMFLDLTHIVLKKTEINLLLNQSLNEKLKMANQKESKINRLISERLTMCQRHVNLGKQFLKKRLSQQLSEKLQSIEIQLYFVAIQHSQNLGQTVSQLKTYQKLKGKLVNLPHRYQNSFLKLMFQEVKLLIQIGQFARAVSCLQKCIEVSYWSEGNPFIFEVNCLFLMGNCFAKMKDLEEAELIFHQIMERLNENQKFEPFYEHLRRESSKLGREIDEEDEQYFELLCIYLNTLQQLAKVQFEFDKHEQSLGCLESGLTLIQSALRKYQKCEGKTKKLHRMSRNLQEQKQSFETSFLFPSDIAINAMIPISFNCVF